MAARNLSFAVKLASLYALFGVVWIFASDTVLAALVRDPAALTTLQTWKGWAFVVASAGLIHAAGARLLRALTESERRYRLLFADSPEALILYDPQTMSLVEMNAAAGRLFGYEADEARGRPLTGFMTTGSRAEFECQLPRLTGGGTAGGVWRMLCRDGRAIDVATHGQTVMVDGRRLRLVQMNDVTARLRAEAEVLRTLEQVATTNERMRELGRALSHDVQEPLRQVSGFVQLLDRRYHGRLDDEAHQFIAYAVEGIHRLKAIISDIELFSQTVTFVPVPVRVDRVVDEVIEVLRAPIEAAGATIEVGALPEVLADSGKLAVIFHVLLDNAVKFRDPGRPAAIQVDAVRRDGGWLFLVRDNGLGIAPEFREAVFSLFSRLHSRAHIPGNGSGLALARKLVETHGGRIWVEDGSNGGVTACFTLPDVAAVGDGGNGQARSVPAQH